MDTFPPPAPKLSNLLQAWALCVSKCCLVSTCFFYVLLCSMFFQPWFTSNHINSQLWIRNKRIQSKYLVVDNFEGLALQIGKSTREKWNSNIWKFTKSNPMSSSRPELGIVNLVHCIILSRHRFLQIFVIVDTKCVL